MTTPQPFESYSGVENLEIMQEAKNYNRYLLNIVHKYAPAQGRILDFGAGSGEFALPMSVLGCDVTAVEPDDFLRVKLRDKAIKAVAGPAELPDGFFDYIYTLNVLEHIEGDAEALCQLHSKLTAGGRLLIYVPAFPVLYTSMDARVGHVRRYTQNTLAAAVTSAGFHIERIAYVDSLGFFATLVFKLAGDRQGTMNRRTLKIYDRLIFPLSRMLDTVTHRWFGKNLLFVVRKYPVS